ncbi:MAG: AI-2E family transporter [Myxococcales bacterium]|jgi:predicted PurR-regulated permease PerM|nr:AI-2E family transporter [Myxococcales bacterium]
MPPSRTHHRIVYALLITVALLLLWLFSSFLGPIVLALMLFGLFQGINEWLVRFLRGHRAVSSAITTLLIVLMVVIPLTVLILLLATQAHAFYLRTRDTPFFNDLLGLFTGDNVMATHLSELFARIGIDFQPSAVVRMAADALTKLALFLSERLGNLAGFAGNVLGYALDFCVMVTVVYALFIYGDELRAFVRKASPLPAQDEDALVNRFQQITRAVFVGNGVASLIQGVFVGLGFLMFDVGPAILFGALSTLLAFLPLVGASLVFIPATIVLLFKGPLWVAALFLTYNIVVSLLLEYWLKSKLIGGKEMNSVLAFLAIIAGIQLFGLMGLFYGPLIVTMFMAIVEIFQTRYRRQERVETVSPAPAVVDKALPNAAQSPAPLQVAAQAEATPRATALDPTIDTEGALPDEDMAGS